MNRAFALVASVPRTCVRQISTTKVRCEKPGLKELRKRQAHFQIEDDVPIFLKGGTMDYVFYYGTLVLLGIGLYSALHSTYKLATRK